MNKDITLLILAAGMGSRFGGLKQVEPMGPSGEFIIDYSIYDAIQAGFTKVVFLIKEENYELFKETVGKRVEPHIPVSYAFQNLDNVPEEFTIPESRTKPLGTAHAILCCKDQIKEPFAIINADDFYGRDAFVQAAKFLKEVKEDTIHHYAMIGYSVANTMTENGSVKRGVCEVEDNKLKNIIESKVSRQDGKIIAEPLNHTPRFEVAEDQTVSMNMLLFTPSIFEYIEQDFPKFLRKNWEAIDQCEFLIPDVLQETLQTGYADVKVIPTNATWYGVTYKEDAPFVKENLAKLVENGEYQKKLWN